jgi:hypothetical protein
LGITLETSVLLNWIVTGVIALSGWALKNYAETQEHRIDELNKIVLSLSGQLTAVKLDYLHKSDFREFKDELWARFDKLEKYLREG